VKKAREGVMEFLLINPPAGLPDLRSGRRVVDLQGIRAMAYGSSTFSRYREPSAATEI